MEKTGTQPLTGSGLYEYAFVPVPQHQRRRGLDLFLVLAGYTSTLSCLVVGTQVGAAMPFWHAILACLLGDLILIVIGTGMGILSARSGWSTSFLAQRILGKSASMVFSLSLLLFTVLWVGVNGNLFSTMLISVFPNWWLPISVTSFLIIALWARSAAGGWKSLNSASKVVVPYAILILLYAMILLFIRMGGVDFLESDPVNTQMTFAMASTAVVGNFIYGCICTADTCRFAAMPKMVAVVCPSAYAVGMFLFHVCGVLIAKAGGFANFNRSATVVGILTPMLICAIFCLLTTQNMNIYIGSLAMQNIFQGTPLEGNISHKTAVYLMAGVAAAFSVSGISQYLMPLLSYGSLIMVPLPGMLFGEAMFFQNETDVTGVHWYAISIWVAGSGAGFLFYGLNLPGAAFWGMLCSFVCYVGIKKWCGRRKS